MLWRRFQKWLGTFTMLLVEGSSETGLFRHLSDHVFRVCNFEKKKCLKFDLDFKNGEKNWEKDFCCWGNCIWIGIVKLCILRAGYFSSVANKLTSSRKFLHVHKRDFSNKTDLAVINECDQEAVTQISKVTGNFYHYACWSILWNGSF